MAVVSEQSVFFFLHSNDTISVAEIHNIRQEKKIVFIKIRKLDSLSGKHNIHEIQIYDKYLVVYSD